jgi:ParB family chromosome partitioning protein
MTENATDNIAALVGQIIRIPIDKFLPSPHQARLVFDQEKLQSLANSMKEEGQLEPVLVKQKDGAYELIFGERRLRAARLAGLAFLDARIITPVSEAEATAKGLLENLQREGLTPIEEARGFQELNQLDSVYWTQAKIGDLTGKGQTYVSESLRLLKLPQEIQDDITRVILTRSHGELLTSLPTQEIQINMSKKIKEKGWSVRETEKQIALFLKEQGVEKNKKAKRDKPYGFHFKLEGDNLVILGQVSGVSGTDFAQKLADTIKEAYLTWQTDDIRLSQQPQKSKDS